jgi:hypothetical protein
MVLAGFALRGDQTGLRVRVVVLAVIRDDDRRTRIAAAFAIRFCDSMYSSHRAALVPNAPVSVPPEYATMTVRP